MAIITPFKVSRAPFLRDVSFFAGCVLFTLFAVRDGRITLLESILLILYYVFYVSFVVIGNWWHQRVKSERELEENARNLYDNDEDEGHLGEDSPLLDEERALLTAAPSRRGSSMCLNKVFLYRIGFATVIDILLVIANPILEPPNIVTQFMTGPYDAYEDEEHDDGYMMPGRQAGLSIIDPYDSKQTLVNSYGSADVNIPRPNLSNNSGDVQDSISLQPPGTPAFKRRPSLISAIEVRLCGPLCGSSSILLECILTDVRSIQTSLMMWYAR
jgi:sodium/potassium/calcium exchanger 6